MSCIRAIVFDLDGVLVDSLKAHIRFCRDKADKCNLKIPIDEARLRSLVQTGTPISPMLNFLTALGFPAATAARVNAEYADEFATNYPVTLFPRAIDLLVALRRRGYMLGFVTANVANNVNAALGNALELFDQRCRSYDVNDKATALEAAANQWAYAPDQIVFVGDQPSDEAAARAAGFRFVGVDYGWGFSPSILNGDPLPIMDVRDLADELVCERKSPSEPPAELKLALEHGRALFIFHAGQRHTTLNYYLVALNVFALAIGTLTTSLLKDDVIWLVFPALVSGFACCIAHRFSLLDKRNEQIVHCDEALLKDAERRLAVFTRLPSFETVEACDRQPLHGGYHKIVPRLLALYKALFAVVAIGLISFLLFRFSSHESVKAVFGKAARSPLPSASFGPPPSSSPRPSAVPDMIRDR